MRIALDFDGTYTADPEFWSNFVHACKDNGDDVRIVTYRYPHQEAELLKWLVQIIPVHYTSHQPKRRFLAERGIEIDIWIDDMPELIVDH